MRTRMRPGRLAAWAGLALALALALLALPGAPRALAAESLSVNLAATTGSAASVGEGFLYGVSQDGTAPPDQFVQPLGITAMRAGGHATPTGGWIADGYTYGTSTKAQVAEVIAQAKRFTATPYHAQYQVLLTDIYGADGSQPSDTTWPCTGGNCANFVTFLDDVVGAIQASGVTVTYDIWNEPDTSAFWAPGRGHHPVLRDVGHRLQHDQEPRAERAHRRARLRRRPGPEPDRVVGVPRPRQVGRDRAQRDQRSPRGRRGRPGRGGDSPSTATCRPPGSPPARCRPTSSCPRTTRRPARPPGTWPASPSPATPTRPAATGHRAA